MSVFIQTPREENAIHNLVVLEKMASGASNVAEAIGETRRAATIDTFDCTAARRCAIHTRRRAQAPLLYYMEETASD